MKTVCIKILHVYGKCHLFRDGQKYGLKHCPCIRNSKLLTAYNNVCSTQITMTVSFLSEDCTLPYLCGTNCLNGMYHKTLVYDSINGQVDKSEESVQGCKFIQTQSYLLLDTNSTSFELKALVGYRFIL